MGKSETRKLRWYHIALMSFVSVWGFDNVVNNYANQGLAVITSWVLIMTLYFIPYSLMVGQLGSAFKETKGGVSSWIRETMGKDLAYMAAWTYWVVHVPYLAQKPQRIVVALGWAYDGDGSFTEKLGPLWIQVICLGVFIFFLWLASQGISSLKRIGSVAGFAILIMSLLYVLLAITAPTLTGAVVATKNITFTTFIPKFNFDYFITISMLVFAVGGAEKISPYVNHTLNPGKQFPKGMILMAMAVTICALLGSYAMGIMFDSQHIPVDLQMNGSYYAFTILGEYYGLGNSLMIIYAITNALGQMSALAFSIDAPLKMLLADADEKYIPKALMKTNDRGTPTNGYWLTFILVGILIIVPSFGIKNMNSLFEWLLNLNAVVMPIRYLFVFLAFMGLMRATKNYQFEYSFVKNKTLGFIIGLWCFSFTAFACVLGMFPKKIEIYSSEWYFQLISNILTPFVLLSLGLILPFLVKLQNKKQAKH